MSKEQKHDLYTFIAGKALESGEPFHLRCNCGGVVTIMPPFQEHSVICTMCELSIGLLIIDGDPGYVIGADANGKPTLLPVQGSSAKNPALLSEKERNSILKKIEEQTKGDKHGKSK